MYKYIVLALIIVVAGGAYVSRDTLKTYFQTGDVPTQEEFADTIDSTLNLNDDGLTADAKTKQPSKTYEVGDTAVKSEPVYQAKVLTEAQKEFKLDTAQPVTFRWTPLVPKPQESVTYRLKVWQLMQGQNSTEAMRTNQPIVTKDVDNVTEATVNGLYTGPCRPPYLCEFIWSVESQTKSDPTPSTGTGTGGAL